MERARTGQRERVQIWRQGLRALEQIAQHVTHALRVSDKKRDARRKEDT